MLTRHRCSVPSLLVLLALAVGGCATVDVPPMETMHDLDYGGKERFLAVDGAPVCYLDEGQGEQTLLFIHPWGGNIGWWQKVAPRFADRYRVVSIDLPGHGKSGKADRDYTLDLAADAVVAVMDELQIERATLIGNSMGGGVSLLVAHEHPARVERLVLVDALGSGDVPGVATFFLERFFLAPIFHATDDLFVQVGIEWFAFDTMGPTSEALTAEILASRQAKDGYAWARAVSSYLRNIAAFDASPWLADIDAPTLVVWGDSDWILWPWSADTFSDTLPNAEVVELEDCGHMPQLERPKALTEAIERFLAE